MRAKKANIINIQIDRRTSSEKWNFYHFTKKNDQNNMRKEKKNYENKT